MTWEHFPSFLREICWWSPDSPRTGPVLMFSLLIVWTGCWRNFLWFQTPHTWHLWDVFVLTCLDSKVHGTDMWPIWVRQDTGVPHVGPMNVAIRVVYSFHGPLARYVKLHGPSSQVPFRLHIGESVELAPIFTWSVAQISGKLVKNWDMVASIHKSVFKLVCRSQLGRHHSR